jgi:hypothetical protein
MNKLGYAVETPLTQPTSLSLLSRLRGEESKCVTLYTKVPEILQLHQAVFSGTVS